MGIGLPEDLCSSPLRDHYSCLSLNKLDLPCYLTLLLLFALNNLVFALEPAQYPR